MQLPYCQMHQLNMHRRECTSCLAAARPRYLLHRRNSFLSNMAANPTWTCISSCTLGGSNGAYDEFIGDPNNSTHVRSYPSLSSCSQIQLLRWFCSLCLLQQYEELAPRLSTGAAPHVG